MAHNFNVFIKNYGCQMNVYDSSRMLDFFIENGGRLVFNYSDADVVILNTCEIREKAEEKLFSDLGRIKECKEKAIECGRDYIVVVSGCVAQLRKVQIAKRSKCVDIILGPQMVQHVYDNVVQVHATPLEKRKLITLTGFNSVEKFEKFPEITADSPSAFVTIQEGCDNFCSYCVVPHTRGREYSRPFGDIIAEINSLVDRGVKEVTLLGQNVNSYNDLDNNISFDKLVKKIYDECGLKMLRFGTSNPHDMTDGIINLFRDIPILMPFLHLPVQSGSNRILKLMNRKYTIEKYKDIIEKIKDKRPDIAFSSDFIVGFPGETDDDFQKTLAIVNYVSYAQAYSFKYSPRPNTKAAHMDNQIDERVKEDRLAELQDLINKKQSDFNKNSVGNIVDVLLLKNGRHEGQLVGRTPHYQAIAIDCNKTHSVGDIVKAKITSVVSHSLIGEIVND